MCIPCVMCGACMDPEYGVKADKNICPECGMPVSPDDISCPHCYTFLYRKPKQLDNEKKAPQPLK